MNKMITLPLPDFKLMSLNSFEDVIFVSKKISDEEICFLLIDVEGSGCYYLKTYYLPSAYLLSGKRTGSVKTTPVRAADDLVSTLYKEVNELTMKTKSW